jgi:hypothetical protein
MQLSLSIFGPHIADGGYVWIFMYMSPYKYDESRLYGDRETDLIMKFLLMLI